MIRRWEDYMPRHEDELAAAHATNKVLQEEVAMLKAKLTKHCNCEFEGDENAVQCTLHNSWASTLHEQADYRRELDLAKAELVNLKPFAHVGMQMVDITTTVRGQDEWGAIPTLWLMCMNERDDAWAELKKLKGQKQ